jgi:dihydrofolate reductase
MAKLLYSATMSADGFIAGHGGDMSWLARFTGSGDEAVAALIPRIGSLLVGRRTYGGDDPNQGREGEGEPFGGGWSGPQFVVTHDPPATAPPDIHFETDLARAIHMARAAAAEKDYVNVLGAEVARGCLELGELDEVLVLVAPILLGDGVRLFDHPGGTEVALERIGVVDEPVATHIWFRVADRGE